MRPCPFWTLSDCDSRVSGSLAYHESTSCFACLCGSRSLNRARAATPTFACERNARTSTRSNGRCDHPSHTPRGVHTIYSAETTSIRNLIQRAMDRTPSSHRAAPERTFFTSKSPFLPPTAQPPTQIPFSDPFRSTKDPFIANGHSRRGSFGLQGRAWPSPQGKCEHQYRRSGQGRAKERCAQNTSPGMRPIARAGKRLQQADDHSRVI